MTDDEQQPGCTAVTSLETDSVIVAVVYRCLFQTVRMVGQQYSLEMRTFMAMEYSRHHTLYFCRSFRREKRKVSK